MLVDDFDYTLPLEAIAQVAIEPRDAARLLDTRTMVDRVFSDLPSMLSEGDLVVVNRTKVRAARLIGRRETGGRTELLLTRRIDHERWQALMSPSKKVRIGSTVTIGPIIATLLSDPIEGVATIEMRTDGDIEQAIQSHGTVPLPPYFHGSLEDPGRYQTMFARVVGSSAAPTAALHFTPGVVAGLRDRGVDIAEVDLNVGLDTFRPMSTDNIDDHRIHSEHISVGRGVVDAVETTRRHGGKVVAVGTTVVRTLESTAIGNGMIAPYEGDTDLFIKPGFTPTVVDAVVTNFHAPRTTLLVLVSTLIGDRWKVAYEHALDSGYRFLSFGDAMFLEVER